MSEEGTTRVIETRFEVDGAEGARQFKAVERAAEGANRAFERGGDLLSEIVGGASILGAGLGIAKIVEDTKGYFERIDRLKTAMGGTTEKAAGFARFMDASGVSAQAQENVLLSMSRRASNMEASINGAAGGMGSMGREAKKYGIDLKKGPEDTLRRMAVLAEQGALDTGKVGRLLGTSKKDSAALMEAFEKGPAAIEQFYDDARKYGADAASMDNFKKVEQLSRDIKLQWQDITVAIGKEMLPVVSSLMEKIRDGMKEWIPVAKHFGEYLNDHMDSIIAKVSMVAKLVGSDMLLRRVTGVGITGNLGRAWDFIKPNRSGVGAAGTGKEIAKAVTAGSLAKLIGMGERRGGPNVLRQWDVMQVRGSIFFDKMGGAFNKAAPFVGSLLKLGGLTAAGLLGLGAFKGFMEMMQGKTTQAADDWRKAAGYLDTIGVKVGDIFGPDGDFMTFLSNVAAKVVSWGAKGIATLAIPSAAARDAKKTVYGDKGMPWYDRIYGAQWFSKKAKEMQEQTKVNQELALWELDHPGTKAPKHAKPGDKKEDTRHQTNNDFRFSKFDILQNFAEGFDPDRIAVAFSHDLGQTAEYATQSQFSSSPHMERM